MAKKRSNTAVIVAGVRTPFVKAFGAFLKLDTIALGTKAVEALLKKTQLPRREIESLVWGGVILPGTAPNIAREICLDAGLPRSVEAATVAQWVRRYIKTLQADGVDLDAGRPTLWQLLAEYWVFILVFIVLVPVAVYLLMRYVVL